MAIEDLDANELAIRLRELEFENQKLKKRLKALEETRNDNPQVKLNTDVNASQERYINLTNIPPSTFSFSSPPTQISKTTYPLSLDEFTRYGRQMIVPSIGLPGQLAVKSTSILIIGAGGLGCPAAAYLAGAGVGRVGICDGDVVELGNLHRQIGHSTDRVGEGKVGSLIAFCKGINPCPEYTPHEYLLSPSNVISTVSSYDLVLDCTDRPSTRYLISDACIALQKPLITASALRADGQLMVLNYPPGRGACYRCVWPRPPPPEAVLSCGEGGIVGPVVGVMGVLMALEAIKLITCPTLRKADGLEGQDKQVNGGLEVGEGGKVEKTDLLLFTAYSSPMFRNLKVRGKRKECVACGEEGRGPERLRKKFEDAANGLSVSADDEYITFCGLRKQDTVSDEEKVDVRRFAEILFSRTSTPSPSYPSSTLPVIASTPQNSHYLLIDVREAVEYNICRLPDPYNSTINIPITTFERDLTLNTSAPSNTQNYPHWLPTDPHMPIYVVCKQGNDSKRAVRKLKEYLQQRGGTEGGGCRLRTGGIFDVKGGLREWKKLVDGGFPWY